MKRITTTAVLLALILGACATTGGVGTAPDPFALERIGGFAICQQLGPSAIIRVDAAGALLAGGQSLLTEIEGLLVSRVTDPREAALLSFIIDTGELASVLPNLGTPIDPSSQAGKEIAAAFDGCKKGAVSVQPKTESLERADLSLALSRYRAAKWFLAHPVKP